MTSTATLSRMLVRRTYLTLLRDPDGADRAATPPPAGVTLERVDRMAPDEYRMLYDAVGRAYAWRDRLAWSEATLRRHLDDPAVLLWRLRISGEPGGFFELHRRAPEIGAAALPIGAGPPVAGANGQWVELAYFGLIAAAQGQGLGRWLLGRAIDAAWSEGADVLWLHTCTLDHPAALPNYRARGFTPVAEEVYEQGG